MGILALIIILVAIFVGKGKGILIYLGATLALIIASLLLGARYTPITSQEVPIALAGVAVTGVAILIGQWKGLLCWILGGVAILLASAFGLL